MQPGTCHCVDNHGIAFLASPRCMRWMRAGNHLAKCNSVWATASELAIGHVYDQLTQVVLFSAAQVLAAMNAGPVIA